MARLTTVSFCLALLTYGQYYPCTETQHGVGEADGKPQQ